MKKNYRYDNRSTSGRNAAKILFAALLLLSLCTLISCKEQGTDDGSGGSAGDSLVYWCPMHPEVQQNEPGECAKCGGMQLLLKDPANFLDAVLKPVSSDVLSTVHMTSPAYKTFPQEETLLGYVDYDNYAKYDISSRYSGRIEKLNVRYNYQPIKKGDIVFEIYSADLVTAQENLLYLLKSAPEEKALIEAARQKLVLLQLTPEQIAKTETSGKVNSSIPVYSKYSGHVQEMRSTEMVSDPMASF